MHWGSPIDVVLQSPDFGVVTSNSTSLAGPVPALFANRISKM